MKEVNDVIKFETRKIAIRQKSNSNNKFAVSSITISRDKLYNLEIETGTGIEIGI